MPIFLSRNFYVFIEFSYISARLPVPAMRLKEKLFIGVSNIFLLSLLCIHARDKHFFRVDGIGPVPLSGTAEIVAT